MGVLDDDRGAVTVEAALALCSLVAVMVVVIGAVSAASAHLRCLDAAREAARLVSRGEPQRAQEVAAAVAPRGAAVDVRVVGDEVHVRVTAAAVPGLPGLSLVGVAVGVMEPAAFLSTEGPMGQVPDPSPIPGGAGSDGAGSDGAPGSDGSGSDGSGSDGPPVGSAEPAPDPATPDRPEAPP